MSPLAPVAELVVHEEAGEGFILHLTSGVYFSLNGSGLIAWRALTEGADPLAALVFAYPDVDRERLQADWEALRHKLEEQGLVTEVQPQG